MATKTGKKRVSLNIKDEDIISKWQTSTSPKEVADALNITVKQVHQRAVILRKNKVPLKKMSRGKSKNWQSLIELANSFNQQ